MDKIIEAIKNRLQADLPGKEAHMKMASTVSDKYIQAGLKPKDARVCAVLIALVEDEGQLKIPFMVRNDDDHGPHAGQICFPGGGREHLDSDLVDTALREAEEEVGIDHKRDHVLGELTTVYIPPSNSLATPVVTFSKEEIRYNLDPAEVAEVFEVSIDELVNPANRRIETLEVRGASIKAPVFQIGDKTIWGATAMMLSEFLTIAAELEETPWEF